MRQRWTKEETDSPLHLVCCDTDRSTKLVSFPWIFHQQLTTVTSKLREVALEREEIGWEVGTSSTDDGEVREHEGWDL